MRQDHPQVVLSTTQHRMHRIAQGAPEPVPVHHSIALHVTDHGFYLLAAFVQPHATADLAAHSFELLCMRVAFGLDGRQRPHLGLALPQDQPCSA